MQDDFNAMLDTLAARGAIELRGTERGATGEQNAERHDDSFEPALTH
jgi:hypothetical protein